MIGFGCEQFADVALGPNQRRYSLGAPLGVDRVVLERRVSVL
jgi:hypothetical protein